MKYLPSLIISNSYTEIFFFFFFVTKFYQIKLQTNTLLTKVFILNAIESQQIWLNTIKI